MFLIRRAEFIVCRKAAAASASDQQQSGVTMALVQIDHDNIVWLTHSLRSPARQFAGRIVERIAHASTLALSSVRQRLGSLAQKSTQRRARTRLTMAERARQRRALANLSDRELRDIGLTRYDVEFVLRQPSWR
jgi:uncharacterized protein YjiS (DUF1127 family)